MKILIILTSLLFAGTSFAKDHKIDQKDRKFSITEITINKGDTITFTNSDKVTHNVFSVSDAVKFDLKTQKPGSSSTVKFDKAGKGEVRCAIHPKMKLKLTVK